MYKIPFSTFVSLSVMTLILVSCNKFLEEKPDKKMVIPESVADLQSLMDNFSWVNKGYGIGEAVSDNYFISSNDFANLSPDHQKNTYIWATENVFSNNFTPNAWSKLYDNVYRANLVLFYSDKVKYSSMELENWRDIKGQALFLRAKSFLEIASIWAHAYDSVTAKVDLGIPLRLDPDFNVHSKRESVEKTYDQILKDLKDAVTLLKEESISKTRASLSAAYALLARTYLYMREYDSCYKYSNICLQRSNVLVDYNTLNSSANFPFSAINFETNPEIIYFSSVAAPSLLAQSRAKIDTILLDMYEDGDLRRKIYFKDNGNGTFSYKGSYIGAPLFDGISTNEVYLMFAESAVRIGHVIEALSYLNTLLSKRWDTGKFTEVTETNPELLLAEILDERRKELVMRDRRWMDIKRLNKENAGIVLQRVINGVQHTLFPNEKRYALPIPEDVISITGMPQN